VRNFVALVMRRQGYTVLSAADGREGLDKSLGHEGKIDLVIADLEMLGMNGVELCLRILDERPGTKALIISGADLDGIASPSGAVAFLSKPFGPLELREKVRGLLAPPAMLAASL